jgi:hypothetical protein
MTEKQIRALKPGDEVKWNDPDRGLCSRTIKIKQIVILEEPGDPWQDDTIISIEEEDGGYIEVFAHELE